MSVATCCRARFLMPFLIIVVVVVVVVVVGLDGGLSIIDGDAKKHDIDGGDGDDGCCCC